MRITTMATDCSPLLKLSPQPSRVNIDSLNCLKILKNQSSNEPFTASLWQWWITFSSSFSFSRSTMASHSASLRRKSSLIFCWSSEVVLGRGLDFWLLILTAAAVSPLEAVSPRFNNNSDTFVLWQLRLRNILSFVIIFEAFWSILNFREIC